MSLLMAGDNDDAWGTGVEPYYPAEQWRLGAGMDLFATFSRKHNIVLTKPLFAMPGRGMGFDVGLTYNRKNDLLCTDTLTGSNWQLSLPLLATAPDDAVRFYDQDGSAFLFENRNDEGDGTYTYEAPSGLRYSLVEDTNTNRYYLTHDGGLEHEFHASEHFGDSGFLRLEKSYDSHHSSNAITYGYDGSNYLSEASDSSDTPRQITFSWETGVCSGAKVLESITDAAGAEFHLDYSASSGEAYLDSIVEASGSADERTTAFIYETYSAGDPYARLTDVVDPLGATTTIDYATYAGDPRPASITDAEGNVTSFYYHDDATATADRIYVERPGTGVKIWLASGYRDSNPIALYRGSTYNGNIEVDDGSGGPKGWSKSGNTGGTESRDATVSYRGDASLKVDRTSNSGYSLWQQSLNWAANDERYYASPGDTYQAKAWIKLDSVVPQVSTSAQDGAYLRIGYYDGSSWQFQNSQVYEGTEDWMEISTPEITLPSNANGAMVVYLVLRDATGTLWGDMVRVQSTAMEAEWDSNQPTSVTNAHGNTVQYEYGGDVNNNPSGNPANLVGFTDHLASETSFVYDLSDRVTQITDETSSLSRTFGFDGSNNMTRAIDELSNEWNLTYDSSGFGLAESVLDANGVAGEPGGPNPDGLGYDIDYNGYGLPTMVTTPLTSTETVDVSYGYDTDRGLVMSRTDGKGQKTCFEHDDLYRLIEVTYLCDTANEQTVTYTYDANDNRTMMVDVRDGAVATTTYDYDDNNRLTQITEDEGWTTKYEYTADGDLRKFTNADTYNVVYKWDTHSRLIHATNPYGSGVIDTRSDIGDRRTSVMYPGGTTVTYSYASGTEDQDRLTEIEVVHSSTVLRRLSYEYDYRGNVSQVLDFDGTDTSTVTMDYDDGGMLASASRNDGSPVYDHSFTYDGNGNRSQWVSSGATTTYDYNPANRLGGYDNGSAYAFEYDENGNITVAPGTVSYDYNPMNRLATVTVDGVSETMLYDGDNQLIEKDDGTILWRYINTPLGMSIEKQDGVVYASYVRLPSGELVAIDGPDGEFFYLTDRSGNVFGIVDASGTADMYEYHPFGEVLDEPVNPKYNPYRFASTYRHVVNDHELYYMVNRWYDPQIGRFTQMDPIGLLPDYTYAGNNPVRFTDPYGLFWGEGVLEDIGSAISGAWDATLDIGGSVLDYIGGDCGIAAAALGSAALRDLGAGILVGAAIGTAPVSTPILLTAAGAFLIGSGGIAATLGPSLEIDDPVDAALAFAEILPAPYASEVAGIADVVYSCTVPD